LSKKFKLIALLVLIIIAVFIYFGKDKLDPNKIRIKKTLETKEIIHNSILNKIIKVKEGIKYSLKNINTKTTNYKLKEIIATISLGKDGVFRLHSMNENQKKSLMEELAYKYSFIDKNSILPTKNEKQKLLSDGGLGQDIYFYYHIKNDIKYVVLQSTGNDEILDSNDDLLFELRVKYKSSDDYQVILNNKEKLNNIIKYSDEKLFKQKDRPSNDTKFIDAHKNLVRIYNDPLILRHKSKGYHQFSIHSAGADGQFNTYDDYFVAKIGSNHRKIKKEKNIAKLKKIEKKINSAKTIRFNMPEYQQKKHCFYLTPKGINKDLQHDIKMTFKYSNDPKEINNAVVCAIKTRDKKFLPKIYAFAKSKYSALLFDNIIKAFLYHQEKTIEGIHAILHLSQNITENPRYNSLKALMKALRFCGEEGLKRLSQLSTSESDQIRELSLKNLLKMNINHPEAINAIKKNLLGKYSGLTLNALINNPIDLTDQSIHLLTPKLKLLDAQDDNRAFNLLRKAGIYPQPKGIITVSDADKKVYAKIYDSPNGKAIGEIIFNPLDSYNEYEELTSIDITLNGNKISGQRELYFSDQDLTRSVFLYYYEHRSGYAQILSSNNEINAWISLRSDNDQLNLSPWQHKSQVKLYSDDWSNETEKNRSSHLPFKIYKDKNGFSIYSDQPLNNLLEITVLDEPLTKHYLKNPCSTKKTNSYYKFIHNETDQMISISRPYSWEEGMENCIVANVLVNKNGSWIEDFSIQTYTNSAGLLPIGDIDGDSFPELLEWKTDSPCGKHEYARVLKIYPEVETLDTLIVNNTYCH